MFLGFLGVPLPAQQWRALAAACLLGACNLQCMLRDLDKELSAFAVPVHPFNPFPFLPTLTTQCRRHAA